jgi:hypothetical protein
MRAIETQLERGALVLTERARIASGETAEHDQRFEVIPGRAGVIVMCLADI